VCVTSPALIRNCVLTPLSADGFTVMDASEHCMISYTVTLPDGTVRQVKPTVLGVGTETLDHHFRPFMYCVCSGEFTECYDAMLTSLAQECVKVNGTEWQAKWVLADAHSSIKLAVAQHYGHTLLGQAMCYFHVQHNIKFKWENPKDRVNMWPGTAKVSAHEQYESTLAVIQKLGTSPTYQWWIRGCYVVCGRGNDRGGV